MKSCSFEIIIFSMDVSLTAYVGVLSRFIKLQLVRSFLDILDALR